MLPIVGLWEICFRLSLNWKPRCHNIQKPFRFRASLYYILRMVQTPKVTLAHFAQINPLVGDIAANSQMIADYAARAEAQGADLVIFPEMALIGYPPEDLVLTPAFR